MKFHDSRVYTDEARPLGVRRSFLQADCVTIYEFNLDCPAWVHPRRRYPRPSWGRFLGKEKPRRLRRGNGALKIAPGRVRRRKKPSLQAEYNRLTVLPR